ncbi:MAG: sigma-54-dependent Fis family transcriptional regulator, partial [Verrucomicrobiales bacterium]|nr:sigma-54-dependent Fis family transcriptional regulator [Verrucomicrobiales bacterium]
VEAMRLGAFDYLTKPFDLGDLIKTVNQALGKKPELIETGASSLSIRHQPSTRLIGHSVAIQRIFDIVRRVAETDSPVLLEGEFGVGKHMVARALHEAGRRRSSPFKELQCSALPEPVLETELFGHVGNPSAGIFHRAGGGTVHLAEIHQLPVRIQAQLNTFLDEIQQNRSAGVHNTPTFRLVTSTTATLEEATAAGEFREDLFYKISVVPVKIPPLRDRREDIKPLVEHFLNELAERMGTGSKRMERNALEFLEKYAWPGNISELRNAVERACAFAENESIEPADLPSKVSQQIEVPTPNRSGATQKLPIGSTLDDFVKSQERLFIQETLKYNSGSREKTASMLGISIATLYRKMDLNSERKTTS